MGRRARVLSVTTVLAAVLSLAAGCGTPQRSAEIDYRISGNPGAAAGSCGRTYTVRAGDTLNAIARRCAVSYVDLAAENGIGAPFTITPGQTLRVPGPSTYTVQRGQNLYRIALAHGMATEELAALNGLRPPYTIYPGQELRVRGEPRRSVARAPQRDTASSRETGSPGEVRVVEAPPRHTPAAPPPPAANAPSFDWPLRGDLVSTYGPQSAGGRKDGWTIAADLGAPVRAAADGEVVYAGNELQGYGELVLVRHEGNWVTAYAHNNRLLVAEGDRVAKGTQIAEAGATGNAERVQLYFEIRRGVTPVDPAQYLQ